MIQQAIIQYQHPNKISFFCLNSGNNKIFWWFIIWSIYVFVVFCFVCSVNDVVETTKMRKLIFSLKRMCLINFLSWSLYFLKTLMDVHALPKRLGQRIFLFKSWIIILWFYCFKIIIIILKRLITLKYKKE